MPKSLFKLSFIFFILIFIPQHISAETFQSKKDNLILTIPDNWIQIPPNTLDEIGKEVVKMLGTEGWEFNYAFQADRKGFSIPGRYKNPELDKWLIYPYILVHVDHGRINEAELYQIIEAGSFKEAMKKVEKEFLESGDVFTSLSANNPFYDHKNQIIWIKVDTTKKAEGLKKLAKEEHTIDFLGVVLTNTGTIDVHCYYEFREENIYINTCADIIKSVQSPGNEYKTTPKWEKLFREALPYFLLKKKK